jgi:hypothetical protein
MSTGDHPHPRPPPSRGREFFYYFTMRTLSPRGRGWGEEEDSGGAEFLCNDWVIMQAQPRSKQRDIIVHDDPKVGLGGSAVPLIHDSITGPEPETF